MSEYNESAYRDARASVIPLKCPFERALLSRCVDCGMARRLLLAEREAITCSDATTNARCQTFHQALHVNARFALHLDAGQPWPFGKEIRAQCGGVLGLQAAMGLDETHSADVARLLDEAMQRYVDLDDLPYSAIMRGVVHYEPRRKKD